MKTWLLPLVLLNAFLMHTVFAEDLSVTHTEKELRKLVAQFHLPSLSVAIGVKDEVVFAEAVGLADIETGERATAHSQYSVASLAKPMTGVVLAKLVEEGLIDLHKPVSEYVDTPSYTQDFSVLELASHLSGIPHDTPERELAEFSNKTTPMSPFDAFYVFDSHALLFEPGTQFAYSSNGYILLSAVIEKAADKPFVDVMDEKLWRELSMKHSAMDNDALQQEVSYYQSYTSTDDYEKGNTHRDRSFLFGAGGFVSTPSDLVKFAQATYDDRYLTAQTRRMLQIPTVLRDGTVNEQNYGVGWRIGQTRIDASMESMVTLEHSGVMLGAATAYLFVVPQCQASIAFATNTVPNKYWKMHKAMQKLLKRFIDVKHCT